MDSNGNKPSKPVRRSSSPNEDGNGSQVVVEISSVVPSKETRDENDFSIPNQTKEPVDLSTAYGYAPTANKPPNILGSTRKSLKRSVLSKPKSRFGEQSSYMDSDMIEENHSPLRDQTSAASIVRSTSKKEQRTKEEDEEIYHTEELKKRKHKKVKVRTLIKWVVFFCIIGCLVASLTVNPLKNCYLWGLKIWKWCLLATVTLCGMIITHKVMNVIVFLIEKNFLLKKKVFYFVHGLKKSVRVTLWLTLVFVTWLLLFDRSSHRNLRSKTTRKILDVVTWTLVTLLIGSFLWLVKTLSLKILASKFHMNRFFDRIQDSIYHHHVLQTLLSNPLMSMTESTAGSKRGRLSFKSKKSEHKKVIDMGKIEQLNREKVSAWTMKVLVDAITSSEMSISQLLDESYYENVADGAIADEMECARYAAYKIFNNIALPGNKFIEPEDLLKVMIEEEVELVLPLFGVDETRKIDRKALTNWVVKVYQERKTLAHALKDTKTAVKQLNNLVSVLIMIATAIIWLLLMEIATTKVLLFLLSQFAVAAFMFGNTCKTIFEALIFVFVMHPFDVGDRCSVDGIPMLVEEMNILTTVFLKLTNEKVYFPNSVLATKSIVNYYRSPDMLDIIEFSIGFTTPLERIGVMKERIKRYLEKNPQHWYPKHSVVVNEIENVNKIKMILYVTHTMNFQDWAEKNRRRSELVMELKTIFEELNISYNLLPQTVHLLPVEGR